MEYGPMIATPAVAPPTVATPGQDWQALGCGIIFAAKNRPTSITDLFTQLKAAGFTGSRSSVYQMPELIAAATAAGIFKPRGKKGKKKAACVREGYRTAGGGVEAIEPPAETA
jgi:hypothetical protein